MKPAIPVGHETSTPVVKSRERMKAKEKARKERKKEQKVRGSRIAEYTKKHLVPVRKCEKVTKHNEHLYYSKDAFGANRAMHCVGRAS
jgi:hypothetical protein